MLSCVASCRDGLQHMSALASVLPCPVPISARSLCRGNRARQSFKDRFSMRPHSAYCEYSLDRHTVSTAGSRTHGGKTTAYRLRRRTAARLLLGYLGACLLGSLGLLLRRRTRIRALCSSHRERCAAAPAPAGRPTRLHCSAAQSRAEQCRAQRGRGFAVYR